VFVHHNAHAIVNQETAHVNKEENVKHVLKLLVLVVALIINVMIATVVVVVFVIAQLHAIINVDVLQMANAQIVLVNANAKLKLFKKR